MIKEALQDVNSDVEVITKQVEITAENAPELIFGADCVVDCLDSALGRLAIAHAASELKIPIVFGAIAGWYGQVSTVLPGDVSFVEIYGSIAGEGLEAEQGNLPWTAASTAAIMCSETVKCLLGRESLLRNKIALADYEAGIVDIMDICDAR